MEQGEEERHEQEGGQLHVQVGVQREVPELIWKELSAIIKNIKTCRLN